MAAALLTVESVRGQWSLDFAVDPQNAETALGAARVAPMMGALGRVKTRLERILTGSTGTVLFTLTWAAPTLPDSIGQAQGSQGYVAGAAAAKDRLINQAEADNESVTEIKLYNALPAPNIPFFWTGTTAADATSVVVPSALNKHLGFAPQTTSNDGTITIRPPSATLKWQFWRGPLLSGHEMFESVVTHECLHLFGFSSQAEATTQPTILFSWDLFRFAESNIPASTGQFLLLSRELRPTIEASWITRTGDQNAVYKASRGTRTGGDGFQGSHWRSVSRLTPSQPIGVMDPAATTAVTYSGNQNRYITRPDIEALDVMGWNLNPPTISLAVAESVSPLSPAPAAVIPAGDPLTFGWESSGGESWTLFIYQGSEVLADNPLRVYEDLASLTLTVPSEEALPIGEYTWYVVASTLAGDTGSSHRNFSVVATCPADFNGDGNLDPDDLADYIACYFSMPPCPEADFNHDTIIDPDDLADYIAAHFDGC